MNTASALEHPSDLEVRAIVVSRFSLDGGAMYGVVPRPMWSRVHPPDEENRVPLVARVLCITERTTGTRVLLEAGLGQRWSEKDRARYAIAPGPDLPGVLAGHGIDPETITHVVLSHLHWDHMSGIFAGDDLDAHDLAFPRAQIFLSKGALSDAEGASGRARGSFRRPDVQALRQAKLMFTDDLGAAPIVPFLPTTSTRGHASGLLVPIVKRSPTSPGVVMATDAIPTFAHTRLRWIAAYDQSPDRAHGDKIGLLWRAFHQRARLCFYHDPSIVAARVDVEGPIRDHGEHIDYEVTPASLDHPG